MYKEYVQSWLFVLKQTLLPNKVLWMVTYLQETTATTTTTVPIIVYYIYMILMDLLQSISCRNWLGNAFQGKYSAAGKFCPFWKNKWRFPKINGANWKMIGRLLANDCRFRNFTLSLKKIQFVVFIVRLSYSPRSVGLIGRASSMCSWKLKSMQFQPRDVPSLLPN
jgi:hypothetical protein